jgi:drug/metabolite transporter (DMT)-like permease
LTHWPGILLALSSAVVWAFYWIFNLRDRREATIKLFMNFCFGFLYIAVILCLTQGIALPPWKGLAGTLWVGFFEMGLTFIFWMKALEYAESTSIVSNVVYLSPFISLIFLKVVVGEQLFFSSILGLILIIAGILIQISKPKNLFSN